MPPLPELDEQVLSDWLVQQRWFGAKFSNVSHLGMLTAVPLKSGDSPPLLAAALLEARFPAGTHELYQVLLGARPADEQRRRAHARRVGRVLAGAEEDRFAVALEAGRQGREGVGLGGERGGEQAHSVFLFCHPERSRPKGGAVEGPFLSMHQQNRSLHFASLRSAPVGMTGVL